MNTSCPACGQIIGYYDLCKHRNPVGLCCCKDEHTSADFKGNEEGGDAA